jgi:hypothetical protein
MGRSGGGRGVADAFDVPLTDLIGFKVKTILPSRGNATLVTCSNRMCAGLVLDVHAETPVGGRFVNVEGVVRAGMLLQ